MTLRTRSACKAMQPRLENLESRLLLYAASGLEWQYGSRITYSFAPDGTNIGGYASNLYASMAKLGISASQVQVQFEKAAAAWQAVTNINLALVSDDGEAFGVAGNQQDDPSFGDIRIGGETLPSNLLASCFLPPPANGGTLAGDVVMNTTQPWQVGSAYDIETVAIHEIGHALGMDHSAIQSACMYAYYTGTKQSLTADDTAGIQSIYGTRQQDSFDSVASNNTAATASNINGYMNAQGQISMGGSNDTGTPTNLDITANTDYDYYTFTAPANTTGTLTVTMQSSNLSSLDPKIILYNSANQSLGTATAPASYGATVSVTVTGVTAGQKFTVKCMAADAGPSGTGAYGLQVNFGSGSLNPVAPADNVVAQQPDKGGGSTNEETDPLDLGTLLGTGDDLTVANPKKFDTHFGHRPGQHVVSIPKAGKLTSHRVVVVSDHPIKGHFHGK